MTIDFLLGVISGMAGTLLVLAILPVGLALAAGWLMNRDPF